MTTKLRIEILAVFGTLKSEDNLLEVSDLLECYTVSRGVVVVGIVRVVVVVVVVEVKERLVAFWSLKTQIFIITLCAQQPF